MGMDESEILPGVLPFLDELRQARLRLHWVQPAERTDNSR